LNILIIDTATNTELIALRTAETTFQFCNEIQRSHSVTMFENLLNLLNQGKVKMRDINLIATGIGPGSFTGVRIAVSTARMMAQILNVPLVGLITHDIYGASAAAFCEEEKILVAFDAKKGRVFGALYTKNNAIVPGSTIAAGDYEIDFLLKDIKKGEKVLCIGDGSILYKKEIAAMAESIGFGYTIKEDFLPSGDIGCKMALALYNKDRSLYESYNLTLPFYARMSDAEIARIK